jgi:transposase
MEELEYVPGHSIVNQIGLALMAHILCSKYGYHLPLYRQS